MVIENDVSMKKSEEDAQKTRKNVGIWMLTEELDAAKEMTGSDTYAGSVVSLVRLAIRAEKERQARQIAMGIPGAQFC